MKTFQLPANSNYGDRPIPVTFPDNWDVHISRIHGYDTPALTEAQIREKLHAAIGTKPISEGAAGKKSAVIIIDDITRPTPCEPIARAVIAELHAAGVPDENIWFIIALGTHGVMYRTEFVRKLGEELVENYEVHNHNLFFNHVFVGNTSNNVPVEINADVMSADYKIAIGTTMAHSYYGFSGGAKCILPGVSSLRTIMRNHSFTTTTEFNMGNPHTLMRSDAEQAARMMGLDFKVDAILNGHAEICNLFAGDFEAEERQRPPMPPGTTRRSSCRIVTSSSPTTTSSPPRPTVPTRPRSSPRSRTAARSCSRPTPRSARACTSCMTSGATPPPAA